MLSVPIAVVLMIVLCLLAYSNSFNAPFVFDDIPNILDNPSIRNLGDVKSVFLPPSWLGVWDRPVVNFSLALNYAISGERVWSYHVLNLLIHLLAGLTIFGIVRRTFISGRLQETYGSYSPYPAFCVSLIWLLHPIQTQAVTYTIQRCESLMGLFYLLTLYCAIRGWQSSSGNVWRLLSVVSFLMGVGSKEVIVTAPFVVLVYEWIFVRSSPKEIWRNSWPLYAGYCIGFVVLGIFIACGATVTSAVTPLQYWQTQPVIILHYMRLVIWPFGLTFDYSWPVAEFKDTWISLVIVTTIFAGSAWSCYRRQPIGFVGLWFFLILAPSSIVPLPDFAFEHRMYLPSAAVVLLFVITLYHAVLRIPSGAGNNCRISDGIHSKIFVIICLVISGGLGILTFQRNEVYRTEERLWEDTIKKSPQNARAHLDLGHVLERSGRLQEAMNHYYRAITLKPDYVKAHINYGNGWLRLGKPEFAADQYRISLRLKPADAVANSGLGKALCAMGRVTESIKYFREVVYLMPDWPEGYSDLGLALSMAGQHQEAVPYLIKAINMRNDYFEAHVNLGLVYEKMKRYKDAGRQFAKAIMIRPLDRAAQEGAQRVNRHMKQKQPAPE